MYLDNRTYDIGKWLVLIFLPALAVLTKGLGDLYQIENIDQIVMTINLITAFFGTILQISSQNYNDPTPKNPISMNGVK